MPDFTFTGPGPHVYPHTKDSAGAPLGTVNPGDIRDLDTAADQWWQPSAAASPPARRPRASAPPEPGPEAAPDSTQEG